MASASIADLLVIIPAFNEEESLPAVLRRLDEVVPEADVVVVDDGSSDATAAVGRAGGAVVLSLPFNLGIGGALRAGFSYAVRNGYRIAIQFDADGQHEATSIADIVAELDTGADLVIGSRFAGGDYEVGRTRQGAMGLLRFIINRVTGGSFTDTSSGFRGFSEPMLRYFATTYPSDYMESVEALLMAWTMGFKLAEVPVVMHQREAGVASNRRLRLAYHFTRLLVVIAASISGRARIARRAAARARDSEAARGEPLAAVAVEPRPESS